MYSEHDELLERWRQLPHHAGKVFIADGIIDPAGWERAPRRVLLLLKEAYSTEKEAFDLREWLRLNGPKHNVWRNAAKWAYAIQNWTPNDHPSMPEELPVLTEALLGCAVVNIKKSDGLNQSDSADLDNHARMDAEYLRRQVGLIQPDLILCGNTWSHARWVWPDAVQSPLAGSSVWSVDGCPVIDFWHPAVYWPHALLYYALGGILSATGLEKLSRR